MCLAIPGKVLELHDDVARVSIDGVVCEAGLAIAEEIGVGDYVIVHAGFVLQKLSSEEAREELEAIRVAAMGGPASGTTVSSPAAMGGETLGGQGMGGEALGAAAEGDIAAGLEAKRRPAGEPGARESAWSQLPEQPSAKATELP